MEVQLAKTEEQIMKCWKVMHALRPHLVEKEFAALVKRMQENDHFQMAYIEEDGIAAAAMGFVTGEKLVRGRFIYVDDLSTLQEHRKKGYGSKLLDWVFQYARDNHFDQVHLDSGTNPGRYDAHRLYLSKGFNITSFHFMWVVS
jgi:GNAT superfamily N-acetyltransferase